MRTLTAICLLLLCLPVVHAEPERDPAGEAFLAFIRGLTDPELGPAARTELVDRYFDFDTWMEGREADADRPYTQAERDEFRQQWRDVLQSRRFRDAYRDRDLRIEHVEHNGTGARVRISMTVPDREQLEYFDVLMTLRDNVWRWHTIRPVAAPVAPDPAPQPPDDTPTGRIERLQAEIERLRRLEDEVGRALIELESELSRLRAEQAEELAEGGAYASPMSTVRTLGRALLAEDTEGVARAHVPTRRPADTDALAARVKSRSAGLATWEALDSRLVGDEGTRATVRVRVTLWPDSPDASAGTDTRIVILALRRIGDEWLVDENP
jgi:hypothetical protein